MNTELGEMIYSALSCIKPELKAQERMHIIVDIQGPNMSESI